MKKKITITVLVLLVSYLAKAQDHFDPFNDRQLIFDVFNICAIMLVVYIISSFILRLVKYFLEYRLKNKMIEKETDENKILQLLQPDKKELSNLLLQWFFLLLAIGVGFTIINLLRPFGLHSLAIMAFSIAAGFLSSYLFTKRKPANWQ